MFCYQCEQTAGGVGCDKQGVCGKDPRTAALQDLLIHAVKGIGQYAHRARQSGASDAKVDVFTVEAIFATLTNVNFDEARFEEFLRKAADVRDKAKALYEGATATPEAVTGPATWQPAADIDGLVAQGEGVTITKRKEALGDDVTGLQELLTYGLKGLAAYADHAQILGQSDDAVYAYIHEALNFLADDPTDVDALVGHSLKCGEVNLRAMELLNDGNVGTYGTPEPTAVRITPVAGKAILVSGHDLKDLADLLEQTAGKGINIYTHGEMLPCHAYPELKKHPHLVGNYGGAWQDQRKEFAAFPGAILMTTNCIQKPSDDYADRIFTTGLVGWPGVKHIDGNGYTAVIDAALAAPGFTEDGEEKTITVGFGKDAVLSHAETVIGAVKAGAIRHFFLIGGCDGARPGRNYYTELAEAVPDDCVILTLACGKYRFNKLDFGEIGGLPRLMDIGQCNDAHSAIQIAVALAGAFEVGVNDLPLSMILSWYEQKACVILLSLLHLGIKNIKLGPSLPAFVTPTVLQVLVDNFNIAPVGDVQADLREALGEAAG